MAVFNSKNKKHHTKAKMFLDPSGGVNVQRFDKLRDLPSLFSERRKSVKKKDFVEAIRKVEGTRVKIQYR